MSDHGARFRFVRVACEELSCKRPFLKSYSPKQYRALPGVARAEVVNRAIG